MGSSATGPRPGRLLLLYGGVVFLLFVAVPAGVYYAVDPEKLDIDQSVRDRAPGRFARLSDGYTHYEIGGPADGRVVVLTAGASVPYYIWDPTFSALVGAGFRVVRYDYYGRGYSDRPDIPYTQDLYVRQLAELLDALQITQPIDLAGLSFGGSVITSVADRHPAKVRSLLYFDPAFRSPQTLSPLESMPRVWSFVTAIMNERWWAEGQLDDFLYPERFPDWPERYREQLRYRGFRRARLSDLAANAAADQHEEVLRVGRAQRPVLIVWGKQDRNVPFELSDSLMRQMPLAQLLAVEDAGHLPQWEQPDIVHPAVIEFLHEVQP